MSQHDDTARRSRRGFTIGRAGMAVAMACAVSGAGILANVQPVLANGAANIRAASASQRIKLGLNKSVVIDLPQDAYDILVANPSVADAVTRNEYFRVRPERRADCQP
jgi:pilus assembly protein CpaC